MKRILLLALIGLLSFCKQAEQDLLVGSWETASFNAGVIQSWLEKDSISFTTDSIKVSTNPLLENQASLKINSDATYTVTQLGIRKEYGKWQIYTDTLITTSSGGINRRYKINQVSVDTLRLLLVDREKIETTNGVGVFNQIQIHLSKH